ncbi:serine/threonine protein kinase [Sinosporangium album]|uniref:Serine/threonine protein kinase n=1 Tax=Sinosporangium album TaxID=504805 RepID=A0A1G8C339_9ACTN|nr:serine/threonine-protein kinase [Sinosporangium album]SDH39718.1 serine/threonine protein kinase [Sinosporangium album]
MYGTPTHWRVPGYTEIRELGTGAAGRVVMAMRDHDGAHVAIKYLSEQLRIDVGFVASFRHEARLLAALDSPYSARLHEYVETGDGAAIVMELVDGVALRAILSSEGPTGPEAALTVLKGSLLGLAAAHGAGLVHRDFKPENVIVEAGGTSKLVDFGIAVRAGDGNTPAGTPPYMAPEQWAGAPAGPATDVYAATIVFYECLTGARPFRGQNIAALARQHQSSPPPIEEVPQPLRGLVERGMAKHPIERPPSAEAFLSELEEVALAGYGTDWEERGRARLAGLAGLLALLFPMPPQQAAETSTAITHTTLEGAGGAPATGLAVKIAIGVGCAALIVGVTTTVVVNFSEGTALQSQTSTLTPSAPATGDAFGDSPEMPDEPSDTPEDLSPTTDPGLEPTVGPSAVSSVVPVADRPGGPSSAPSPAPSTGTPSPSRTASTAPPTRTPRPERTRATPTAAPTEEAGETGNLNPDRPEPGRRTEEPEPTPTATRTPPRPTPPPTTTPPAPTPTDSGGGTESPAPTGSVSSSASAIALGLMTSLTLPVTIAVRRVSGRHRKRR